jgi:L-ascorbate metabolism protein UlaG (beta-lactamase superfamily)
MEITWFGHSAFRLRAKEGTVVIDPTPRRTGGASRLTADVVLVSHEHPGHNELSAVAGQPRVLSGPGEYEVKGISILGVATYHDQERGKKRGRNTAYVVEAEDLVVCHLGDLGHLPTAEQLGQIRNAGVLLIPVGGGPTIDATQAVEVISLIEPRLIIPMHYRVGELDPELDPLDKFLREMGESKAEPQPRISISAASLPETAQVVVLEPRPI